MPFAPRLNSNGILNNPYWYSDNPYWQNGYGLPNCTCYAWGRVWEETGVKPVGLAYGNAEDWYPNTPDSAFVHSQTPALGAVLCLYGPGDYGGHVAVVEEISGDGSISVSESAYQGDFWRYTTGLKPADGYRAAWAVNRNYVFQGFLIPPSLLSGSITWHAKALGGYSRTDQEAIANARNIYYILYTRGWTLNAVAGLLGNIEAESGLNPWRWESDIVLASTDMALIQSSSIHGYGFTQFTPSGKYILDANAQALPTYAPNFSDAAGDPADGEAQIIFVDEHADYIATSSFPMSYAQYKASELSPEYLAAVWVYNYERPGSYDHVPDRQAAARYWYDLLQNMPLIPPTGKKIKKLPIWMMNPPGYHILY